MKVPWLLLSLEFIASEKKGSEFGATAAFIMYQREAHGVFPADAKILATDGVLKMSSILGTHHGTQQTSMKSQTHDCRDFSV